MFFRYYTLEILCYNFSARSAFGFELFTAENATGGKVLKPGGQRNRTHAYKKLWGIVEANEETT